MNVSFVCRMPRFAAVAVLLAFLAAPLLLPACAGPGSNVPRKDPGAANDNAVSLQQQDPHVAVKIGAPTRNQDPSSKPLPRTSADESEIKGEWLKIIEVDINKPNPPAR